MEQPLHLCPKFEATFSLLGKRWTGLIIRVLMEEPKRFKDITYIIPNLSDKMLTERMKELIAEGIVIRNLYDEMPTRIEYELTEKGKALHLVMEECQKWADEWME